MSIVFSAIVPHSPILIPAIGKENRDQLKATVAAYLKLEQDLYAAQPETIIIISPHGPLEEKTFVLNLSPEFTGDFTEFGDAVTKFSISGDVGLAHKIREQLETTSPLKLASEIKLDHGALVPLYLLTEHLKQIKIIPLYYSGLSLAEHFEFGQKLKEELLGDSTRVAIIASGDLSHRLNKNAPGGYSPKGKKFDNKLIENLKNKQTDEIVKLSPKLITEVAECGLKSIVIMLGILKGIKYEPQLLSYEAPFGVGNLVMNFKL